MLGNWAETPFFLQLQFSKNLVDSTKRRQSDISTEELTMNDAAPPNEYGDQADTPPETNAGIIIVYLISIRNPPRHQPLRMKQQPCITGKDMRKEKECMPFFLVCLSVGPSVCHIFSLSFFLLIRYLYFHLLSFTKAISRLSTLCLSLVLRFFPSLALFMDHLLLFILYIYLFLINTVRWHLSERWSQRTCTTGKIVCK